MTKRFTCYIAAYIRRTRAPATPSRALLECRGGHRAPACLAFDSIACHPPKFVPPWTASVHHRLYHQAVGCIIKQLHFSPFVAVVGCHMRLTVTYGSRLYHLAVGCINLLAARYRASHHSRRISRPTIIRMTSLVPSRIWWTRKSRKNCCTL